MPRWLERVVPHVSIRGAEFFAAPRSGDGTHSGWSRRLPAAAATAPTPDARPPSAWRRPTPDGARRLRAAARPALRARSLAVTLAASRLGEEDLDLPDVRARTRRSALAERGRSSPSSLRRHVASADGVKPRPRQVALGPRRRSVVGEGYPPPPCTCPSGAGGACPRSMRRVRDRRCLGRSMPSCCRGTSRKQLAGCGLDFIALVGRAHRRGGCR